MTVKLFLRVLLANCLIIICFNLLTLLPDFKSYALAPGHRILTGLCLYGFQFAMTWYLLKDQRNWLTFPFKAKFLIKGAIAFLIALSLTAVFVSMLDDRMETSDNTDQWLVFFQIFLLNSLPGALMEEWLFRCFPFRLAHTHSLKMPSNIFFLLMLLLFTLIHIPAYLFQYDAGLSSLGNIFVSGIFLFLIYFMTRNVVYTALFHAFCNNPKFVTESTLNWQYFYASIFLVTIAWPLIENQVAKRRMEKEDVG
ncbi:CPBP family glutamic-type intramembrane protease [Dyadobacter psychrotolerans]|uniref:CPBP family intramembrane metalloprotease n=1 Tax=Dyadobacter psychrotolerans TaxID=2541721 RepID=A0A4R5DU16_9BACT|nr:CPBP family glutamic-type intramembrane protease [Dyadobacter psychrotolerans]TDE14675.1 CPBP family intramembrane metalloprotease [Dyadobacter psychrotolerans]